ncbi:MAG TPA: hypothetical protein VH089_23175 [Streptosporangiaceae bacterium]|nr:hypothetical protein [Streptosporangiaceae bacterium]
MRRIALLLTVLAGVAWAGLLTGCAPAPAAKVSARVILDARTVAAGAQLPGRVIVDNQTGHALHIHGCGDLVQVTLSSRHYHPALAAPDCAETLTVPTGQTTYRVRVLASYLTCSNGDAEAGIPKCAPGPKLPPLPPGTYQASLDATASFVPAPPPIQVHLTRP